MNDRVSTNSTLQWALSNSDQFEGLILALCAQYPEFFHRHCLSSLCVQPDPRKREQLIWCDDFTRPIHYPIYRAIYAYQMVMRGHTEFHPMRADMLHRYLSQMPELLMPAEFPMASQMYQFVAGVDCSGQLGWVSQTLPEWIKSRRVGAIISQANVPVSKLREDLEILDRQFTTANSEFEGGRFGAGMDSVESAVERCPCGFYPLDKALGGGFGRGESYLFYGGTGAGKTVAGMQFASGLALAGYKVGVISTEQPQSELEPRIISANCNIPFSLIKDGGQVAVSKMAPDQLAKYHEFREIIGPNLGIVKWVKRDKKIQDGIKDVMKYFQDILGGLDVLMLDWIGRSLGDSFTSDASLLRMGMMAAASAMVDIASSEKIATVDFAQVKPAAANTKIELTAATIAECSAIANDKTCCMGITALQNPPEADGGQPQGVHAREQFFYFAKTRKEEGFKLPVLRDMLYQRFRSRN